MKVNAKTLGNCAWELGFIVLVAVILANYWIGYYTRAISPLPAKFPIAFLIAPFCGALVYLFTKKLRRAFYATVVMCVIACIITVLFIVLPSFHELLDFRVGTALALRFIIIMGIFAIPLALGGAFFAAYLYPE